LPQHIGFVRYMFVSGLPKFEVNIANRDRDSLRRVAVVWQFFSADGSKISRYKEIIQNWFLKNYAQLCMNIFQQLFVIVDDFSAVLWIHDILVRIRIRGSVHLTKRSGDPDPVIFISDL
jgi:hypothetical protein